MTFFKPLIAVCLLLLAGGCVSPRPQEGARPARPAIARIEARGVLLVGSTGDYRPLTWRDPETGRWEGFGIEVAERIAARLGIRAEFVQTSWPTLAADVQADPPVFDLAIGGITVTDARRETMDMSDGYLANGKTILCRAEDAGRFRSLADIDRPDVRVLVNPGGLNEAFARENLPHAGLAVHPRNEEIPSLVADGTADVMVAEIVTSGTTRASRRRSSPSRSPAAKSASFCERVRTTCSPSSTPPSPKWPRTAPSIRSRRSTVFRP